MIRRIQTIKEFSLKLIDSHYTKDIRREIIQSSVKRYFRLRLQEESGVRRLYRSGEQMAVDRRKKGSASTWFKSRRGGEKVRMIKDNPMRKEDSRERR